MARGSLRAVGLVVWLWAGAARAQEADADAAAAPDADADAAAAADAAPDAAAAAAPAAAPPAAVDVEARAALQRSEDRLDALAPLAGRLGGFLDVGFFAADGNGAGVRSDPLHRYFPAYAGQLPGAWVLVGDPLATAVNSRGDPADLGGSRAFRDDRFASEGAPTFVINTLALALDVEVGERWTVVARADLLPGRLDPGELQAQSERVRVPLAHVRWTPGFGDAIGLRLYAGKIDSVLGIEYRRQDAPLRLTVTPSLLCRYTCGRPTGLAARADGEHWRAALTLVNGDLFDDGFVVHDELDSNRGKTVAARAAVRASFLRIAELGVSGALGSQDEQGDDGLLQWHVGVDLQLEDDLGRLEAEWIRGRAPGAAGDGVACAAADCLRYQAAYLLVGWFATPLLTVYARGEWRDASHRRGVDFAYESRELRHTLGARYDAFPGVAVKLEWLGIHELDPVPDFGDDVVTSSLVVDY
jgi:hypothetical protein